MTETPGTKLHEAWKDVPAPPPAIDYWRLPPDAMWVDCLKRMLADESHHRDVNHAMASMTQEQMFGEANPFIHEHKADCTPQRPRTLHGLPSPSMTFHRSEGSSPGLSIPAASLLRPLFGSLLEQTRRACAGTPRPCSRRRLATSTSST